MKLEELQPKATVKGILPDGPITVVSTQWYVSAKLGQGQAFFGLAGPVKALREASPPSRALK